MRSTDSVIHDTGGVRWLSFPPLDAFPFFLHGFLIKNQAGPPASEGNKIERVLSEMASDKKTLVSLAQTHQSDCVVLTSRDEPKKNYRGDAILTDRNDVFLSVRVADCLPIFLVEERRKVIGLVHAGWRGTLLGITRKALGAARDELACSMSEFKVVLGPCIQGCCYDVSDGVAILFDRDCVRRAPNGKARLDLIAANLKQLVACGVEEDSIFVADRCTFCDADWFFSHRREGESTGRMVAFTGLK